VSIDNTTVVVTARDDRRVPVLGEEREVLAVLASALDQDEYLFHPGQADRDYKNFVNDLCAKLDAAPDAPRLSAPRCRSSFVCDLFSRSGDVSAVLYEAGIEQVESLISYVVHIPPAARTKAQLRALRRQK
jgi:hypothetical protein